MEAEIVRYNPITGAPISPYLSVDMKGKGFTPEDLLILQALRLELAMITEKIQDKSPERKLPVESST